MAFGFDDEPSQYTTRSEVHRWSLAKQACPDARAQEAGLSLTGASSAIATTRISNAAKSESRDISYYHIDIIHN